MFALFGAVVLANFGFQPSHLQPSCLVHKGKHGELGKTMAKLREEKGEGQAAENKIGCVRTGSPQFQKNDVPNAAGPGEVASHLHAKAGVNPQLAEGFIGAVCSSATSTSSRRRESSKSAWTLPRARLQQTNSRMFRKLGVWSPLSVVERLCCY